jgi:AcrR family transcriptional regulator
MEAIAAAAGVGTATVYNHFANKNVIAGFVFLPVVADLLADSRWIDPAVPPTRALKEFIEELSLQARKHTPLTVSLLEAVNDSTARRGGEIAEDDPRFWVPLPPILTSIIRRGQESGQFLLYPPAGDAGPLFTNLLLLRILTRPNEAASETARLMLTILFRTFAISND